MRKLTATLAGAGVIAATLIGFGVSAQAEPAGKPSLPNIERAYPNEGYTQYYRRGYRPYYGHRHYRRYDGGSALAAGAVGLAAGALIGSAIASQAQAAPPPPPGTVDPQLAAYCARKYRSYDPASGTFLSTNGMRYVCTY
ncbi:BA14K family protein [Microvirga sp. ACRRW]|uniref:BA14K family protein n=1 Tax=Microvirga sp. ACRRW TaxID=2918205 RepID=UPI001EF59BCA|nr:BA14K family protein [Microvirga sp. ACRRW]MCG7394155.1 BA14K family protein [Microvirga sp. ACRRW]